MKMASHQLIYSKIKMADLMIEQGKNKYLEYNTLSYSVIKSV